MEGWKIALIIFLVVVVLLGLGFLIFYLSTRKKRCTKDSDCPGQICINNTCVAKPTCVTDRDCPSSSPACISQQCYQCRDNSQCGIGQICQSNTCITQPVVGCSTDADCPFDKRACIDKVCYQCRDNSQCGIGQICQSNTCVTPGCSTDADCPLDKRACIDKVCYQCKDDSYCPTGKICRDRTCVSAPCVQNSDCKDPTLPYCKTDARQCVRCLQHRDCVTDDDFNQSIDLYCDNNNTCSKLSESHCTRDADCNPSSSIYRIKDVNVDYILNTLCYIPEGFCIYGNICTKNSDCGSTTDYTRGYVADPVTENNVIMYSQNDFRSTIMIGPTPGHCTSIEGRNYCIPTYI